MKLTTRPLGTAVLDEDQIAPGGLVHRVPADHREQTDHREPPDQRPPRLSRPPALLATPRRILVLTCLLGAGVGALLAGPVAATALAGYCTLGVRALLRRATVGRADRERRERLDQLCALAGDLRVGLPVPVAAQVLTSSAPSAVAGVAQLTQPDEAVSDVGQPVRPEQRLSDSAVPGSAGDRLGRLAGAAVRLAERTGAPLADLVERIEADARSTDRGLAAATAQASGARATAWLLAALPLGGIGLGYGIGADPLQVLLHTPVGGACAIAAVGLQVIGLLWAERLAVTSSGDS